MKISTPDGNLPAEINRFFGRTSELTTLRNHVEHDDGPRLVTVTGPPGVGKSRLAQQIGRQVRDRYRHGVWIVYLADLEHPKSLAHNIAEALRIVDNTRTEGLARLIEALRDKQLLLILDNCEHLLPAVQKVVRTLMQGCEQVRIVATSQESLGLTGEQLVKLAPLRVTGHHDDAGGSDNTKPDEAVQLFVDRARAADEEVSEDDIPLINKLCALLDGLPLALELAAGLLRQMTLRDIYDQLVLPDTTARFRLLVDGDPTGQQSHQALSRAISLSATRCTPAELALWARLSVFPADFDRGAVEQVCAGGDVAAADILSLLGNLVRKSILTKQASPTSHRTRYRMLQSIRLFGRQLLAENDDLGRVQAAFAEHYRNEAEKAARDWFSPRELQWLRSLREDWSNHREAVAYYTSQPEQTELALVMSVHLSSTRAAIFGGMLAQNLALSEEAIAANLHSRGPLMVSALCQSAWIAAIQGHPDIALPLLRQAHSIAEQAGCVKDHAALGYVQGTFGFLTEADATRARASVDLLLETLESSPQDDYPGVTHMIGLFAGFAACFVGRKDDADRVTASVLVSAEAHNAPWCISWAKWGRALYELTHGGDLKEAWRLAREALREQWNMCDQWGVAWTLWLLALIASRLGQHELAALLSGGSTTQQEVSRVFLPGLRAFQRLQERVLDHSRTAFSDYAVSEALGKAMQLEQVVEAGLAELPASAWVVKRAMSGSRVLPGGVSEREFEVAGLVADGLTSKQIGSRLGIEESTVVRHVHNARGKLGMRNRLALAQWYRDQRIDENAR
ncbi:LuxR C-terminal-related transcriptional regulator [Umezawaea sp. Da 62-37]|uniref:ATP-binding protein n=1 Tax=Umezawaea sp. Da 62-37 TaxID=3075927 RepID=UPI0028F7338A|nr:LuxR C-terminal-related transcriptional regulator [Umezawaea sp. Da 62-37]WNV83184.1 LuxR C-terminal-related transcriptional regulator [Umezawaea sp. Da 62-37]